MIHIKETMSSVIFLGIICFIFYDTSPGKIKSYNIADQNITEMTTVTSACTATCSEATTIPTTTTAPVTTISTTTSVTTTITTPEETTETSTTTEIMKLGVINGEITYDTDFAEYPLPDNPWYTGFKSYEPYDAITAQSVQLLLQYDAIPDANGFRLLDDRYLVAVGTFCNAPCGTYIDLLLENGILIPCIVGDIKSDGHTDEKTHTFTRNTMCASEFIIDSEISPAKDTGNISTIYPEWNAKVQKIRVY